MSKFKKGDRVRMIHRDAQPLKPDIMVGRIGIITEDDSLIPYCDFDGEEFCIEEENAELYEEPKVNRFNVGDKVTNTSVSSYMGIPVGSIGVIEEAPSRVYRVRFPVCAVSGNGFSQTLDWEENELAHPPHTITIDGKDIELSAESFAELKAQLT